MINIASNDIIDIAVANTSIEKAYIGSMLVWQKVQEPFIEFIDSDLEYICCVNWGRYIKETVKTVVTADSDIVTITTTSVPYTAKVAGQSTVITSTREKTESDVVGTTTVTTNIMVGTRVSDVQSILGQKALILHKLRFIYFTSSFDKTIPIYGLKAYYGERRKVDCFLNFNSDNGSDYLRLYVYYQRWGYLNGSSSGYSDVTESANGWYPSTNNVYITLFKDYRSRNKISQYVTFRAINGSKPATWRRGLDEILVSIDDVPNN